MESQAELKAEIAQLKTKLDHAHAVHDQLANLVVQGHLDITLLPHTQHRSDCDAWQYSVNAVYSKNPEERVYYNHKRQSLKIQSKEDALVDHETAIAELKKNFIEWASNTANRANIT